MEKRILQCVTEEDILFTNKKLFKDSNEHSYTCNCYDGVAVCTPTDEPNLPMIVATYPKKKDVLTDNKLCEAILEYRGLYDLKKSQITFGDIMLKLGKLTSVKDNNVEAALKLMSV